ncbi:unnamed protein product, partial [Rhizoctonia solani]
MAMLHPNLTATTFGGSTAAVVNGATSSPAAATTHPSLVDLVSSATMPFRERIQRGFKQVKGKFKAVFPPEGAVIVWKCLTELAGVLGPAGQAIGPIKQVVDEFAECIAIFNMAADGQRKYDVLQRRLENLFEDLANHLGSGPPTMTESMESICKLILKELDSIKMKRNKPGWKRYLEAGGEVDEILVHYTRIADNLERLSLNANLSMWKIMDQHATEYHSDRMSSLVDRLPSSLSARYNSTEAAGLKRRECTPDTRVGVLAHILGWAGSSDEGSVYWLNGMAGTGKTTITYSVCTRLDADHKLAASFFCSRLRGECRNVNVIFPSIAYQLARFSRPFMSALSAVLKQDPDAHTRSLRLQYEALITKPLSKSKGTLPDGLVVVIDALDECEDKQSTGQMLDILLGEAASLPIRFIISSRPEPEIRDRITKGSANSRLVLHELGKGAVQADIELYLRTELSPINPSNEEITALVERAGILFIYAATAIRFIGYDNFRRNPGDRLRTILDGSRSHENMEHKEIDQLYTTILGAAFNDALLRSVERDDMQQVLHTVICAREPLTVRGLSELLRMNSVERVRSALRPLWSVLHVIEASELVGTLHASFPDFIFDSARSEGYHCDANAYNRQLAERCFECISGTKPQFNICGLESSYLPDESVPDLEDRVIKSIPQEL